MDKLVLVFDCLRDPRDLAQIIHLSIATNTKIILTGNSLSQNHYKVINILKSWVPKFNEKGFNEKSISKTVLIEPDYFKCVEKLKKEGFVVFGTSSNTGKNLFSSSLSKGKHAIVFGTETSGLSKSKIAVLDGLLCVPMKNNTSFFTISVIAPVICFEVLRQKKLI